MFLFAHEGYTILFAELISLIYYSLWVKKRSNDKEDKWGVNYFSIFAIIFGAMGPDLVDKILIMPFTGFGRHIGHSLLFNLLISIAVFLVFRKRKRFYLVFHCLLPYILLSLYFSLLFPHIVSVSFPMSFLFYLFISHFLFILG